MNLSNKILSKEYEKKDLQDYLNAIVDVATNCYSPISRCIELEFSNNDFVDVIQEHRNDLEEVLYNTLIHRDLWAKKEYINSEFTFHYPQSDFAAWDYVMRSLNNYNGGSNNYSNKLKISVYVETKHYNIRVVYDGNDTNLEVEVNEK